MLNNAGDDSDMLKTTQQYEGLRLNAYDDVAGVRTVGYGHNLNDSTSRAQFNAIGADYDAVKSGQAALTPQQAQQLYQMDMTRAQSDVKNLVPNYAQQPTQVQSILNDLSFNMGATKLAAFKGTLGAITAGNYASAAQRLQKTPWYPETRQRGKDIVSTLAALGNQPITSSAV